jgi:hypothetical protein
MVLRYILLLTFLLVNFQELFSQNCQNDSTGFIPLIDLGLNGFHGMKGGLYGNGENNMPEGHLLSGLEAGQQILPLNTQGEFDINGKLVLFQWACQMPTFFSQGLGTFLWHGKG